MSDRRDALSSFEDAGPAFIHLFYGGGGGQEGVIRGVEGGRAAVPLFYRQRAGSVLQSLGLGQNIKNKLTSELC